MNDVMLNKIQSIQRCIQRACQEYAHAGNNFALDYSRQDAAILNILRACAQSIDLANHVIKQNQGGIPNSSSESFQILANQSLISPDLATSLKKMVGFRNIAIHEYQRLDIDIVVAIIEKELGKLVLLGDALHMQKNIIL
jgi:uncharacterized protein YutE (UPF0331/DUF86 family)